MKKKRGRPSNAELKRRKEEAEKTLIIRVIAAIGIILSAVYMLFLYKRIIFG